MLTERATTIKMMLEFKKPKSMTSSDIGGLLGCSAQEVRRRVNELRTEGVPVCATSAGYFISDDPEDMMKTINSLEGRIKSIKGAAMGMRECMKKAMRQ